MKNANKSSANKLVALFDNELKERLMSDLKKIQQNRVNFLNMINANKAA